MAEFSAWSDVVLGGANDQDADAHEIRGCVTLDVGPAAPRTWSGEAQLGLGEESGLGV